MEYFEGGEEYGWEEELSSSIPEDGWIQTGQFHHTSTTPSESSYLGDGSLNRIFSSIWSERSALYTAYRDNFFNSAGGYAGNYYTDYNYGQPATSNDGTTAGTYAGVTRSTTPIWRQLVR